MWLAELIGYAASVLLAVSLIINNDLKFRWINSFGCTFFIVYGILISAFPIILTNSILLLINVIYLIKIYRTDENFDLVEFSQQDPFIERFINFYKQDLETYFANSSSLNFVGKNLVLCAVTRNMVIAWVFVAEIDNEGHAHVKLNYTVPKYRDFNVGRILFQEQKQFLTSRGINKIVYEKVQHPGHSRFLKIMGFKKSLTFAYSLELLDHSSQR
jgi:hypothetical protein